MNSTLRAFPIVNLNGTSGAELAEQCKAAWAALQDALQALQGMAPHGRDYQTAGPATYSVALAQHEDHVRKLESVKAEIMEVYDFIEKQNHDRELARRTGYYDAFFYTGGGAK
jgi:hypothetical protein